MSGITRVGLLREAAADALDAGRIGIVDAQSYGLITTLTHLQRIGRAHGNRADRIAAMITEAVSDGDLRPMGGAMVIRRMTPAQRLRYQSLAAVRPDLAELNDASAQGAQRWRDSTTTPSSRIWPTPTR